METYEQKIEIPFGAKDSELQEWTYTIPEGMEAEIKNGKVIIKRKESEDKPLADIFEESGLFDKLPLFRI